MTALGTGRASAVIAAGTTVSRVLGFVKALALAAAIGNVGVGANAYQTATYVPNSITAIVAGGLLTAVLVPQIVRAAKAPDGGEAYVNKLVTLAVVAFGLVAVAATLSTPLLMTVSNGAGSNLALATAFGFWSLPQVFFLGLYTVLGEVLTARRSFGPYMWAPVLNNVVGLAMLGVLVAVFGADPGGHRTAAVWQQGNAVALLAGGATLGIACQALVLTLAWRAAGLRFRPDFGWRGVGLRATGQAAGWTFAMLLVTQAAGLVEVNVANTTGAGPYPSSFTMAQSWLLFMLPHSVVTVSIVTVFYPRMSEHAADGDLAALRGTVGRALTTVLTLLVLADAALLAAAVPFARLFTDGPAQARGMGLVLVAYLAGLVPFSALFVVQRCFYALADTRTPFRFTLAQAGTVAAAALLCLLAPPSVRAAAIALAVSLAGLLQLGIAAMLLRRRIGGLGGREVADGLRTAVVAGVPALAAGGMVSVLLGAAGGTGWAVDGKPSAFAAMAAAALAAAVVFALVLRLQGSRELAGAAELVARRFRR